MTIVRRESLAPPASLQAAGWPPVLARIYAARGIRDAAELDHSLAALPGFATFANIGAAADRLADAIAARERIVIVADYDADGATACAVGVLRVRPGAINVVPGEVELDVDVRDSDAAARQAVVDGLLAVVGVLSTRRGLTAIVDEIVRDEPASCTPAVVAAWCVI